ncbi:hypothetical protein ACFXTN_014020 [Malus domestica]
MPEDSVYYHPTLNPTGAPPLGKPPMFKSSMGPRIPLSAASSSGAASSSKMESEDAVPLAESGNNGPGDGSVIPESLPLPPPPPPPPPPPLPPNPAATNPGISLPPPPPPPPGPLPKEQISNHPQLPLLHLFNCPPSLLLLASAEMRRNKINLHCLILTSKDSTQVHTMLPPPPPGLPPKSTNNQSGGATSDAETNNVQLTKDFINMVPPPPPPPPRQQPPVPGPTQGISRFPPPPPPPDMRPPLSTPGLPTRPGPPGNDGPNDPQAPIWSSPCTSPNDETTTSTWAPSYLSRRSFCCSSGCPSETFIC